MQKLTPAQQKIVDALTAGKIVRVTECAGHRYYAIEGELKAPSAKAFSALEEKGIIRSEYFSGIYRLVTR